MCRQQDLDEAKRITLNLGEKNSGGENKKGSLKNDINFILAPLIYVKQKWLLTHWGAQKKNYLSLLSLSDFRHI